MNLILAIVSNDDARLVTDETVRAGFRATKLASSGGFLHAGNTTLILGVRDCEVDAALNIIEKYSKKRTQMVSPCSGNFNEGVFTVLPVEITVGGATCFVLPVDEFRQL